MIEVFFKKKFHGLKCDFTLFFFFLKKKTVEKLILKIPLQEDYQINKVY